MSKPTVLFLHGSWHSPVHFQPVREVFEAAGYPTVCPLYPSYGARVTVGLKEDSKTIIQALQDLVDEEKEILVIAHSYGGMVATESVKEEFGKKAREAQGKKGGVVHILYLCAFLLHKGQSLASGLGPTRPPYLVFEDDGMCYMAEPEIRLYNDIEPLAQQEWIKELKKCPTLTQTAELSYEAYMHHPWTYLYCTNDQALPVFVQKMMVENSGVPEGERRTEGCDAGHSPYLSMPEKVLEVAERALKV